MWTGAGGQRMAKGWGTLGGAGAPDSLVGICRQSFSGPQTPENIGKMGSLGQAPPQKNFVLGPQVMGSLPSVAQWVCAAFLPRQPHPCVLMCPACTAHAPASGTPVSAQAFPREPAACLSRDLAAGSVLAAPRAAVTPRGS